MIWKDELGKMKEYDAVLGGGNPPPIDGLVLGGIEGVKRRLASGETKVKIAAVKDALSYQEAGLDVVIQALKNDSGKVQRAAYMLLKSRAEPRVEEAIKKYEFWNLKERLQEKYGYNDISRFANRKIEEFHPDIGLSDPLNTAYIVGQDHFPAFLEDPQVSQLKALILGWGEVDVVVKAKDKLTNLKALHTGPCNSDCMMSWLGTTDISPILKASSINTFTSKRLCNC